MQELFTSERLQEMHRLAELGRMSAVLLHEISNPLTAALLHLESGDHKSVAVRRARRDMQLMKRYVEAARQQVGQPGKVQSFYVQPQLDQMRRIITPVAQRAGVQLEMNQLAGCRLRGDPIKFQQIITNLVKNAIDAYQGVPVARPRVMVTLAQQDSHVLITVTDYAAGIPDEALPQLFDEFYTTKGGPAYGLGIGLAIVKRNTTEHFQGTIDVASGPTGTCFTVRLPVLPCHPASSNP